MNLGLPPILCAWYCYLIPIVSFLSRNSSHVNNMMFLKVLTVCRGTTRIICLKLCPNALSSPTICPKVNIMLAYKMSAFLVVNSTEIL